MANKFDIYDGENSISFFEILLLFVKQIKILILIPFIFVSLSIFYSLFIAKESYISPAKIISSSPNSKTSSLQGLASRFGLDAGINDKQELSFVYEDILRSRDFAKTMLEKKFDSKVLGKQKPLMQILNKDLSKSELLDKKIKWKTINGFIGSINFEADEKKGIIELSVIASEAELAKDLTRSLILELDRYQQDYNKSIASKARKFIESRIDKTQSELQIKEEKLKTFRDRNRRIENSPNLLLEQERLVREVLVLNGVFTTLKQQLETVKIDEVKESAYVLVIDSPETPIQRFAPKEKKIVIFTFFGALALSIALALIIEIYKAVSSLHREKIKVLKDSFISEVKSLK